MKSELGKALQEIADSSKCYSPCHRTKWHWGRATGGGKYKRQVGNLFYSKGGLIGGGNSDQPKRFHVRRRIWKAKEEPRGYVAGDC